MQSNKVLSAAIAAALAVGSYDAQASVTTSITELRPSGLVTTTQSDPDSSSTTSVNGNFRATAVNSAVDLRVLGASGYEENSQFTGEARWSGSYTNNTGTSQRVNFAYHIFPGFVSYFGYANNGVSNGGVSFALNASNGASWYSALNLNRSDTQFNFTVSGIDIYNEEQSCEGVCFGGTRAGYSGFDNTLDLGIIADGATVTLDYLVSGYASQSYLNPNFGNYGIVFIGAGDPAYFSAEELAGNVISPTFVAVPANSNGVPSPAINGLLLAGLLSFGAFAGGGNRRWPSSTRNARNRADLATQQ
jgi:hypothetical protein